jgi:hypothetical protein
MVRLVWPLGAWDYVRQFGLLGLFSIFLTYFSSFTRFVPLKMSFLTFRFRI